MRKRRVVGRIYGMKYSWKGHKDRNRHKNRIKRSGQARLSCLLYYRKSETKKHTYTVNDWLGFQYEWLANCWCSLCFTARELPWCTFQTFFSLELESTNFPTGIRFFVCLFRLFVFSQDDCVWACAVVGKSKSKSCVCANQNPSMTINQHLTSSSHGRLGEKSSLFFFFFWGTSSTCCN